MQSIPVYIKVQVFHQLHSFWTLTPFIILFHFYLQLRRGQVFFTQLPLPSFNLDINDNSSVETCSFTDISQLIACLFWFYGVVALSVLFFMTFFNNRSCTVLGMGTILNKCTMHLLFCLNHPPRTKIFQWIVLEFSYLLHIILSNS